MRTGGSGGGTRRHQPSIPRLGDWRHWLRLSIEQRSSPWPDGEWDISIVQFGSPDQKQPRVSSLRENCLWPQRSPPASLTQVKYSDLDWNLSLECSTRSCPPPWGGTWIRDRRCTTCRCSPNSSRTNFLISMVSLTLLYLTLHAYNCLTLTWPRNRMVKRQHCNNIAFFSGRRLKFHWCKYDVDALWYCNILWILVLLKIWQTKEMFEYIYSICLSMRGRGLQQRNIFPNVFIILFSEYFNFLLPWISLYKPVF